MSAVSWTAEELWLEFLQGQGIFLFQIVQTYAGACSYPCSVGTASTLLGGLCGLDVKLITLHLVPRLLVSGAIPPLFSICLHGMKRNNYKFLYAYFTLRCAVPPTFAIFVKYLLSFISSQSVRVHENHSTSGLAKDSVFESIL